MYDYLKGVLTFVDITHVTVEAAGLGYKILLPSTHLGKLPPLGQEVILFLSMTLREPHITLFGFLERQERAYFERLVQISGIGPKMALNLLGHLSIDQLESAAFEQDTAQISRVPGIGKKTAERLLVELKGKNPLPPTGAKNTVEYDALTALIHLGYSQVIAKKALEKSRQEKGDLTLSEWIKEALAHCR